MSAEAPADASPPQRAPGKPWLLILIVAVLAAGAAGGGAWFLAHRGSPAAEPTPTDAAPAAGAKQAGTTSAPAQYFSLGAPLVVNLTGSSRYLQVEIELVTRNAEAAQSIEQHAPALRAGLLMLLGQEQAEALVTREGKERLQRSALEEVRRLMVAETGKPCADALLFTSFVMQ